jgi:hypothetical protein
VRLNTLPAGQSEEKTSNALMNVITPASEYNSTERVNTITERVIVEEIKRAS